MNADREFDDKGCMVASFHVCSKRISETVSALKDEQTLTNEDLREAKLSVIRNIGDVMNGVELRYYNKFYRILVDELKRRGA